MLFRKKKPSANVRSMRVLLKHKVGGYCNKTLPSIGRKAPGPKKGKKAASKKDDNDENNEQPKGKKRRPKKAAKSDDDEKNHPDDEIWQQYGSDEEAAYVPTVSHAMPWLFPVFFLDSQHVQKPAGAKAVLDKLEAVISSKTGRDPSRARKHMPSLRES